MKSSIFKSLFCLSSGFVLFFSGCGGSETVTPAPAAAESKPAAAAPKSSDSKAKSKGVESEDSTPEKRRDRNF